MIPSAASPSSSTTVVAIMQLNGLTDPNFLYAGQVLTIIKGDDQNSRGPSRPRAQSRHPVPTPTPPMGKFGPKWVDVNLTTQTMVAYEGETPVYSSRVSSGVYNHPTVLGTYRIYAKYVSAKMVGGTPGHRLLQHTERALHYVLLLRLRPARRVLAQQLRPPHEPRLRQPPRRRLQVDVRLGTDRHDGGHSLLILTTDKQQLPPAGLLLSD